MKKFIALVLSLAFVLALVGCSNENTKENGTLSLSNVVEIEITYENGNKVFIVDGEEDVLHICNNLESLELKQMDYNEPTVKQYGLKFFDANGNVVEHIDITVDPWLAFGGYCHSIESGTLEIEYITALVEIAESTGPTQ